MKERQKMNNIKKEDISKRKNGREEGRNDMVELTLVNVKKI